MKQDREKNCSFHETHIFFVLQYTNIEYSAVITLLLFLIETLKKKTILFA